MSVRLLSSSIAFVALAAAIACVAAASSAMSADVTLPAAPAVAPLPQPPSLDSYDSDPGNTFEARFGEFVHGIGSVERYTPDISAAIVTPRLNVFHLDGTYWLWLIPRAQVGGNLNVAGRTSFAYLDAVWTMPIGSRLFVEPFLGGAVHDGGLLGTAQLADLGCRELFHAGASVGVRLSARWRLMGTFEHLSNGERVFDTNCGTNRPGLGTGGGNQGLNNYGLRFGYAF